VSTVGLCGERLDIDNRSLPHDIIVSVHEASYVLGLGKCSCDAMLGDLGEKGQFSKGRGRRWVVSRLEDHREIIPFLLAKARTSISITQVAIVTLFKPVHHSIAARTGSGSCREYERSTFYPCQDEKKYKEKRAEYDSLFLNDGTHSGIRSFVHSVPSSHKQGGATLMPRNQPHFHAGKPDATARKISKLLLLKIMSPYEAI
jgi:hypothetical protein